jgi:hypothetical protein
MPVSLLLDKNEVGSKTAPAPQPRSVTLRAVVIAFLLIPLNTFWLIQMELVRYSAHPTTVSLMFNAIFVLLVFTGINHLLHRIKPSLALSQGELLLIYSVMMISSCVCGHDFIDVLVGGLTYPYHAANASNGFQALFWHYLPSWALMPNVHVADGFYQGHDTLYTREHLLAWCGPVLIWTIFITVLLFVMQCVNVLIRKQWTDNERLTYPLVKLPLEITSQYAPGGPKSEPLTRNRIFWIGFAIAAIIDINNSLNYYYPQIPPILAPGYGSSQFDLQQHFFVYKPWSAIGWTPITYYPFIVGIGMLMPLDFLFSCWFFYIFWKLQLVMVSANAWDTDPRMPYANYQALGAYLLFFVSTVTISRGYFKRVFRKAVGLKTDIDDHDEPLTYRGAFIGILAGLTALVAFSAALGMAWWLAVAFFAIYFALALAITRMRAELGTPVHDLHFTGPDWALADLIGPRALGPQNLAVFSVFFWFNRAYRCHPMPAQLEAWKMADESGARSELRKWFWVLLTAGGVSALAAMWALLHCAYVYGGNAKMAVMFGNEAWDRYRGWLTAPQHSSKNVSSAIIVGFLFAAFLQAMRIRLSWWPFHPLAYAVSGSWEMNLLWFPLLIAYVTKLIIVRYGGSKMYKDSLPFFYGLMLGQFVPGSLLNIWGIITGTPTYQFWQ